MIPLGADIFFSFTSKFLQKQLFENKSFVCNVCTTCSGDSNAVEFVRMQFPLMELMV